MKKLILFVMAVLISASLMGQIDTTWTKTVQIDTTEIVFNLKVIQNERVIFKSNQPIPLMDRRWDWYYRLTRNIWSIEEAQMKIEQMKQR